MVQATESSDDDCWEGKAFVETSDNIILGKGQQF